MEYHPEGERRSSVENQEMAVCSVVEVREFSTGILSLTTWMTSFGWRARDINVKLPVLTPLGHPQSQTTLFLLLLTFNTGGESVH